MSDITLTPATLPDFLLAVAPVRPVYIKGPPGIGKSSLVAAFAETVDRHSPHFRAPRAASAPS